MAHALEALLRVADSRMPETQRWQRPEMRQLRCARSCYGHLAGELGVRLHDALMTKSWAEQQDNEGFALTREGVEGLSALGIAVNSEKTLSSARKIELYPCLDWSERRDHFAGPVATQLLDQFIAKEWLKRVAQSRALQLTPRGQEQLVAKLLAY